MVWEQLGTRWRAACRLMRCCRHLCLGHGRAVKECERMGATSGEGNMKKRTEGMPAQLTARQQVDSRRPTRNHADRSTQEGPKIVSGAHACRFHERLDIFSRQATQLIVTTPVTEKGASWCVLERNNKETMTETGSRSDTKPTALMRLLPIASCLSRCFLVPCTLSSQSERVRKISVVAVGHSRAGVESSGGSGRSLGRARRSRATALEAGLPRCRAATAVAAEV